MHIVGNSRQAISVLGFFLFIIPLVLAANGRRRPFCKVSKALLLTDCGNI